VSRRGDLSWDLQHRRLRERDRKVPCISGIKAHWGEKKEKKPPSIVGSARSGIRKERWEKGGETVHHEEVDKMRRERREGIYSRRREPGGLDKTSEITAPLKKKKETGTSGRKG